MSNGKANENGENISTSGLVTSTYFSVEDFHGHVSLLALLAKRRGEGRTLTFHKACKLSEPPCTPIEIEESAIEIFSPNIFASSSLLHRRSWEVTEKGAKIFRKQHLLSKVPSGPGGIYLGKTCTQTTLDGIEPCEAGGAEDFVKHCNTTQNTGNITPLKIKKEPSIFVWTCIDLGKWKL